MKQLLSHFQVTRKSVTAFAFALALYIQNLGRLPETPREWGFAAFMALVAMTVPAREPNANKDPSLATSTPPAADASSVAGKPAGSLTTLGGNVIDPATAPTPGPNVPIGDDGRPTT